MNGRSRLEGLGSLCNSHTRVVHRDELQVAEGKILQAIGIGFLASRQSARRRMPFDIQGFRILTKDASGFPKPEKSSVPKLPQRHRRSWFELRRAPATSPTAPARSIKGGEGC